HVLARESGRCHGLDELHRVQQALLGMLPPQGRLDRDRRARPDVDLRVEEKDELVGLDGATELVRREGHACFDSSVFNSSAATSGPYKRPCTISQPSAVSTSSCSAVSTLSAT